MRLEIQHDKTLQAEIQAQGRNDKAYVRINMKARKGSGKPFYTLVPKDKVPQFPLYTHIVGGVDRKGKLTGKTKRGGTPVKPFDLRENWRRAAKKTGLWQPGMGPHVLMSVFESTAGMAGVNQAAIEMCRGHRQNFERYGYARQAQNEQWMAGELGKYWEYSQPASMKAVMAQAERLTEQAKEIERLRGEFETLLKARAKP